MANKILIAYFSHWGHTKQFAEEIQRLTGGTLFKIRTSRYYSQEHDPCSRQAHQEQLADDRPVLTSRVANMDEYDTVLIGHPIWWYREPMVIRSFWETADFTDKVVIPFCTSGDVGIENTVEDTKHYLPGAIVKPGLRLGTHTVADSRETIRKWLQADGIATK